MATKASKFVYEIAAEYTGEQSIKRLQADLDKIGAIEGMAKIRQELQDAAAGMKKMEAEAARLKDALSKSFDPKIFANLTRETEKLGRLDVDFGKQEAKLNTLKKRYADLKTARDKAMSAAGSSPTEAEAAKIEKLNATLAKAEAAWRRQGEKVREAGEKMAASRARIEELNKALAKSRDPALARQYEEQRAALEKNRSTLEALKKSYKEAAVEAKKLGVSAKDAAKQMTALQESANVAGRGMAARKTLGIRSDSDIKAEVAALQRAYKDLAKSGNASLAELARAKTAMRQRIRELTAETNGWTAATGRLQAGFAKVVLGLGALRLGRAALDSLTQYDDAMRRVSAITGATAKEFEELDAKAQHLAATTSFSASEVAAAMQQLAAAGQSVEQIQNSIQAAMDIAAIAQMDVGVAADQLTNIMAQFGIEAKNSANVADALVAGFTGAATTMDQLANAMTYAGPVANALGYTLEDTTAILMGLANAGYKGERAGTALRGGFTRLIRPMKMGREVLEKYNIEINDADGKMRDFTDIMEDIGRAGMTTAELIKIFGQEAGPGMIALLSQGSDAIRDYRQQIDEAGGKARELAEEMESGIGGARRRLEAATDAMLRNFAGAIEPVLKPMIEALAEFFGKIAQWSPQTKQFALGIATVVGSMTALGGVIKTLSLARFVFTLGGLAAPLATAAKAATGLGVALRTLALPAAALAGLFKIAELAKVLWDLKRANDEVQKSQERGQELRQRQAEQLERISQATGVTIKTFQQLQQAEKEGRIHYDQATQSWKKGAAERQAATEQQAKAVVKLEGEALREVVDLYKKYADEIKSIQDDIAGRQQSLAAELREMGRSGMTDAEAWRDQKREAEEYMAAARRAAEEAKALAEAGDEAASAAKWQEAVKAADDAKTAYKALNKEIKDGDQVIVSQAEALETAMQGVKEAGELGVELLKRQQEEIHKLMRDLERDSGMAGLADHLDDAALKMLKSWEEMNNVAETAINQIRVGFTDLGDEAEELGEELGDSMERFEREGVAAAKAVEKAIDRAARDRHTTIHIREGRRLGGIIGGDPARFARGGKLPGYGGGDRIPALLESGEFVIRKEAVKKFGAHVFTALNNLRLPELPDLSALLPSLPRPVAATPMGHMVLELKLPGGDSVTATVSKEDAETLARHNRRVSNLRFRK